MKKAFFTLFAAILVADVSLLASSAELPYTNPNWAQSAYPSSHARGNFTALTGPVGPGRTLKPDEIKWTPLGPVNSLAPMYSSPYPNGKRVIWVGGFDRIAKLDADTLEVLSTYAFGGQFFSDDQVKHYVAELDRLSDEQRVAYGFKTYLGPIRKSVMTFYRVLSNRNELFISHYSSDGSLFLQVFGDKDEADPASDIVLKREWKIPSELSKAKTLMGITMTPDGRVVINTQDGVLISVAQDFSDYSYLRLPRRLSGADTDDVLSSFTRNGIVADDKGGIYVVTRDYLHRVQWTGKKLSLDEADGAWSETYPNDKGIGSGTTPSLMGWGDKEDHLVLIADASSGNNMMAFWRDKIPDDWKGLAGSSRRVAGVTRAHFGVSKDEDIQIENTPVVYGYGAFINNTYPEHPLLPRQDAPDKKWMAESLYMHVPGHEARGGGMVRWDPHTRVLKQTWQSQANFASTVCTVSEPTETLYCWGARDRQWTLEGVDWKTGKSAFHYILGKSHRYNPLGAPIIVAPNGAIDCGCWGGMGFVRVQPKAAVGKEGKQK